MLETRLFLLGQHRNEINDVITSGFLLGQHGNKINDIITPRFSLSQHGNEIDVIPHPSKGAGLLLPWIRPAEENIRTLSHNNTF